jgi:glycosyltransferase involved in cell wall biosynthesis
MEKSHIHLFTSNHLEGWGAVVNEAMNSGCAEVVNSQVGAAPFLVQHKKNGLIYKEGSYEDFLACVLSLFENKEKITQYGKAAYESIVTEWNAQTAAARILQFYENWQQGVIKPPASGPLSVAPVISPRKMYRAVVKS